MGGSFSSATLPLSGLCLIFLNYSINLSVFGSASFQFLPPNTIFLFSAILPPLLVSCQSFSGLALQCSWCWQWNTRTHATLTLSICSVLAGCHGLQTSDATCQVAAPESRECNGCWEITGNTACLLQMYFIYVSWINTEIQICSLRDCFCLVQTGIRL